MLVAIPSFSATGLLADYSRRCEGEERHNLGKAGTGARVILHRVPILVKIFLTKSPRPFCLTRIRVTNKMDGRVRIRYMFTSAVDDTIRPRTNDPPRHFLREVACAMIEAPTLAGDFSHGENSLRWKRARTALAMWLVICTAPAMFAVMRRQSREALTWNTVRENLDREARNFHSLSAKMQRTKVTVVVDDHSTESGDIFVRGDKMLLQIKEPDPRSILRLGDNLYIYNPGLKRVEEYNLGKNRALVDQFLLLGFGTRGSELEKSYGVKLLREERMADQQVAVLDLIPKSGDVLHQISKIQIWLSETTWLPVQQEFYEAGSGDYSIVRYSNVEANARIPDSTFRQNWPKGTQKVKLQN
jgi:outer membrane lipoprotein-sorting protein